MAACYDGTYFGYLSLCAKLVGATVGPRVRAFQLKYITRRFGLILPFLLQMYF